jgi:penicillin amidase
LVPYFADVNRTLMAVALVTTLFTTVALVFVWYVSFGMGRPSGGEVQFAALQESAHLYYYKDGTVAISAGSELDGYRALGYQAGRDHGWMIALLRQTAAGRLGEWFGSPVLQLDKFARQLGFSAAAQEAAALLSDGDAAALSAYAEGVSQALRDKGVTLGNEFVLFDVHPQPWEGWHSLAISRMIAWLSEPPITVPNTDPLFWANRSLEDNDRRFRNWLHLHGADMSAAWSWRDSEGAHFAARFVYGASALPLFSAVSLDWPRSSVAGIVLLGTPFLPVISGSSGVRITTFSSRRSISASIGRDNDAFTSRHERILDRWGDETLVSVRAADDKILVGNVGPADETDSTSATLALSWSGLSHESDWPAWRSAVLEFGSATSSDKGSTPFEIVDGDGFTITAGGLAVTGSPGVVNSFSDRLFVSNNLAVESAGRRLADDDADLEFLIDENVSAWARENAPRALALVMHTTDMTPAETEAIEYLRNWDYRYDVGSIGASIFDGWMIHYRDRRGTYPEILVPSDTVALAQVRIMLRQSLKVAVDSLEKLAGPDLARWRLESLRRGERSFPVWSYRPLQDDLPNLVSSRYAPIEIPQGGHPTTLIWQPGLDDEPASSPSHVVVRGLAGRPRSVTVVPDYEIGSGFIARYIAGPPRIYAAGSDEVVDEVRLVPKNRKP